MRKETREICQAFLHGEKASGARTRTDGESLYLHDNEIAGWNYGDAKPALYFTLAGWNTVTTRERLNGLFTLLGSNWGVIQKNFEPYAINTKTGDKIHLNENATYFLPIKDDDMPNMLYNGRW